MKTLVTLSIIFTSIFLTSCRSGNEEDETKKDEIAVSDLPEVTNTAIPEVTLDPMTAATPVTAAPAPVPPENIVPLPEVAPVSPPAETTSTTTATVDETPSNSETSATSKSSESSTGESSSSQSAAPTEESTSIDQAVESVASFLGCCSQANSVEECVESSSDCRKKSLLKFVIMNSHRLKGRYD